MSVIDQATRRAAPWVERLARAGYASKGVVFVIIGFLTATAAFHGRSAGADRSDAFQFVLEQPFGRPLLAVVGVGLVGYAIWKLGSALRDWEQKGSDAKGLAVRAGIGSVGVLYTAIAIEVFRLAAASGSSGPSGSDEKTRHWTARALDVPLGRWIVGAVGIAIVAYGIQQALAAWNSKLSDQLRLGSMSEKARRRVVAISRFGIAARAVVFMIVGASVLSAAIARTAAKAHGTAGAMSSVSEQPFGKALLAVVAAGVVAYGIYCFINARYRMLHAR